MDLSRRVVTRIPVDELWTDVDVLNARRTRYLQHEDIRLLLRAGPVRFVVADVGDKLNWIEADCTYSFWHHEAKPHLNSEQTGRLDDYPDEYFYFASEWLDSTGARIILLEKYH